MAGMERPVNKHVGFPEQIGRAEPGGCVVEQAPCDFHRSEQSFPAQQLALAVIEYRSVQSLLQHRAEGGVLSSDLNRMCADDLNNTCILSCIPPAAFGNLCAQLLIDSGAPLSEKFNAGVSVREVDGSQVSSFHACC